MEGKDEPDLILVDIIFIVLFMEAQTLVLDSRSFVLQVVGMPGWV